MAGIRTFLRNAAGLLPLSVHQRLSPRPVLGFYYHVVSDTSLAHIRHLYAYKNTAQFTDDMQFLSKSMHPVTYSQLEEVILSGHTQGPRPAQVTFDDGLAECYTMARSLLLRQGIPCVFFLITECVDNREMAGDHKISLCIDKLTSLPENTRTKLVHKIAAEFAVQPADLQTLLAWMLTLVYGNGKAVDRLCQTLEVDWREYLQTHQPYLTRVQIAQMVRDGFTFGSHSRHHVRHDFLTRDGSLQDILASCHIVKDWTGQARVPFAFPFSADGIPRHELARLREENASLGLFFGTDGIRRDAKILINRLCADWTRGARPGISNLPALMRNAYLEDLSRRVPARAA